MARRRPDWADLPSDLVASIGGLLIAGDIADFIRFRGVCHPWRSSTDETRRRSECLHPRSWIALTIPKPSRAEPVEFYNTSTHDSFEFDLKDYLEEYLLFRTSSCLILLQNKNTEGVYVTSSSTIILRFSTLDYLVWTKPGDLNWVYAEYKVMCWSNVLFYEDRFLFFDSKKGFVQINFAANGMSSQPKMEVAIPDISLDYARHLIDCDNKIFMVSFDPENCEERFFWESLEMCELNLNKKECVDVTEIGRRSSIFFGYDRAISVSYKCGLVPANCIYFCDQCYDGTALLNLSINRLKFSYKKPFYRPNPFVKKLINYCR